MCDKKTILKEIIFEFLVLVLFLTSYVALLTGPLSIAKVHGDSMWPTIQDHDVIPMVSTALSTVQRGDVVVLVSPYNPELYLLKRVIGMPGEIIEAKDDSVYVDGKKLETAIGTGSWGPVTIPDGAVFVMGDNRSMSGDSRHFGCVPVKDIRYRRSIEWNPKQIKGVKRITF